MRNTQVEMSDSKPHRVTNNCGGVLVLGDHYKARFLAAEYFQHGWPAEEFLRQHPDLRPEQVYKRTYVVL